MSDLITLAILEKFKSKIDTVQKLPGPQGERGLKGEKGDAGKDGKDGRDGIDGKDGRDGEAGKDGVDGKDGNDGVSVVDATVDFDNRLKITLSDGNEIDAGEIHIDGGDNITINKSMSGGGGGFSGNYLDMDGKGIIARFEAAETLLTGDVCRLDSSGKMAKADALAEPLCNNMIAMSLDELQPDGTGRFQLSGYADVAGFSPGDILYVELGGGITAARPATSGAIVRVLGYAISPTQIFFDPDKTWIEVN